MVRLVGPGYAGVGFESAGDAVAVGQVEIERFVEDLFQIAGDLGGSV